MDSSAARKAIFQRIRSAQGRSEVVTAEERARVAEYLAAHSQGPRPKLPGDLLTHFETQARRMSDTVERVEDRNAVPEAVGRYLKSVGVPPKAIAWNTLTDLDWVGAGMEIEFRKPVDSDLVGITGCYCAVAETGSLMLLSGSDTFASASLLPETHIAVLHSSRIVAGMEDAFALARKERGELPRATNFISGPSRTGDIEQTIVLGAHGPYRVHVIIVDES